MNKQTIEKKKRKIAEEYIEAHITSNLYDCIDSMREVDVLEAKWEALTDNKPSIKAYIQNPLNREWEELFQKKIVEIIDDLSGEGTNYQEKINKRPGGRLLFPYRQL